MQREYVRIEVPEALNLDVGRDYAETMDFIEALRDLALRKNEFVLLDFSKCTEISGAAAIVLAAEAQRCRRLRTYLGKPKLTGTYPKDNELGLFLRDLGFFSLLGVRDKWPHEPSRNTNKSFLIALKSGVRTKGPWVEALCDEVLQDVAELSKAGLSHVYRGVTEAMNNVTDHAYSLPSELESPVLNGQWWVAGYRDRETQTIVFIMYDQGVGIPATIDKFHKSRVDQILRDLGLGKADKDLIHAAMQLQRSSTGTHGRGYGLMDMRRLIDASTQGVLEILSRRGAYQYSNRYGVGREDCWDLPAPLGGTLIHWEISQSGDIEWKEQDEDD